MDSAAGCPELTRVDSSAGLPLTRIVSSSLGIDWKPRWPGRAVRTILGSAGIFFVATTVVILFLTTKVLEMRRWA